MVKMANDTLVLCKPLCFLVTKLGKLELKVIKSALLDYYSSAEITEAKRQLIDNIHSLQLIGKIPQITDRRNGENRSSLEVEDVFKLIAFLDETKQLDKLPKYVTDDPDAMPSIRLFEGDLSHIMSRMERIENRLEDRITGISSFMAAIAHDISVINNDVHKLANTNCEGPAIGNQRQVTQPAGVAECTMEKPAYATVARAVGNTSKNHTSGHGVGYKQSIDSNVNSNVNSISNSSWAASCSTPSDKLVQRSRPSIYANTLQTGTDSESTDHHSDSMDEPWGVQRSRKKRRRNQLQDEGGQSSTVIHKGPLVIGVSSPTKQISSRIKAAQNPAIVKKLIFCIGNVDPTCTIQDMCDHVTAMSVRVISCYDAKPRRRRTDTDDVTDRKAFRLCINSEDCAKLLDATKWPAHVYVSEWYFKSASTQHIPVTESSSSLKANQDNAHRIINVARSVETPLNNDVNIYQVLNQDDAGENEAMTDGDETILAATDVIPEDGGTN